jgi:hypothetical protein
MNSHYVSWVMENGMHFKVEGKFDSICALFHILKTAKDVKEVTQGSTGK